MSGARSGLRITRKHILEGRAPDAATALRDDNHFEVESDFERAIPGHHFLHVCSNASVYETIPGNQWLLPFVEPAEQSRPVTDFEVWFIEPDTSPPAALSIHPRSSGLSDPWRAMVYFDSVFPDMTTTRQHRLVTVITNTTEVRSRPPVARPEVRMIMHDALRPVFDGTVIWRNDTELCVFRRTRSHNISVQSTDVLLRKTHYKDEERHGQEGTRAARLRTKYLELSHFARNEPVPSQTMAADGKGDQTADINSWNGSYNITGD